MNEDAVAYMRPTLPIHEIEVRPTFRQCSHLDDVNNWKLRLEEIGG